MTAKIRKLVAGLLALGLVLAPNVGFAQATYFWWQVVDEVGRPYPSQTVSCSVYDLASHGAKELFLAPSLARHVGVLTSMPLLSDANSRLHFWSESTSDIRAVCYYARGGAATDVRLSRFAHTVMIDRQGRKVVRFPFVTNSTNQATSLWLPQGAVVRDVMVQNLPGSQGGDKSIMHLNVGFRGNHAGAEYHAFVNRLNLGSTDEWIRPGAHIGVSPGTGGLGRRYHVGASHRGAALAYFAAGGGIPIGEGAGGPVGWHQGFYLEVPFVVHMAGGIELSYQTSNTPGLSGHVYVIYDSYHTGVSTTPAYGQ